MGLKPYVRVAIGAALKSGIFLKRSIGNIKKISYKGRINIVTDCDKRSEEIIVGRILSAFPDHSILTEESRPIHGRPECRWIIDPLDGTTNFSRQFPFFAVSIAFELEGRVVLGVVYDPMREELFYGEEKMGARLNNRRIAVSGTSRISEGFLATGFAYGIKGAKNTNIANFRNFLMRSLAIRRAGSAALDMCYVACGRFDGFWEMGLYPWDTAAAFLIVKEAGGMVTKLDGTIYRHYDKEVLASNGKIHRQMVDILNKR